MIMKRVHWFVLMLCLALSPVFQSCDDDEGYSIGDFTPPLWATVRVGGGAFYLDCDVWGTLWPVNTDMGWYTPVDGQRVITYFNPLWDNYEGYDHAVKILGIQNVLTKQVETLTPETDEEFGNDPVTIFRTCPPRRSIALALCVRRTMPRCMVRTVMFIWSCATMTTTT